MFRIFFWFKSGRDNVALRGIRQAIQQHQVEHFCVVAETFDLCP